jgi:hypothetical protein
VERAEDKKRDRREKLGKKRKIRKLHFTESRPDVPYFSKRRTVLGNNDYGSNANTPSLEQNELAKKVNAYIYNIRVTLKEHAQIELETRGQFENKLYKERRKLLITATWAQEFANMKDHTQNCMAKLDSFFKPVHVKSPALGWGISYEKCAIELYEAENNVNVQPSGLFISTEFGGLAASPEGLIGMDGLLEIKCPWKERFGLPEEVANRKPKDFLLKANGVITLNKRHKYYDQFTMQLHVTNRVWCDFAV